MAGPDRSVSRFAGWLGTSNTPPVVAGLAIAYAAWLAVDAHALGPAIAVVIALGLAVLVVVAVVRVAWREALRPVQARRDAEKHARSLLDETRRRRRRLRRRLSLDEQAHVDAALHHMRHALADGGDLAPRTAELATLLDGTLAAGRRSVVREYATSVGGVIVVALVFRSLVAGAYVIPSGSMMPTLQIGDRIFVNKLAYGLHVPLAHLVLDEKLPARGDVVVFDHPREPGTDLIKRVVGVPGDVVSVRDDVVTLNGVVLRRAPLAGDKACTYEDRDETSGAWSEESCSAFVETNPDGRRYVTYEAPDGAVRDFGPVVVPPGHVFVMGDNRDHSSDSRYWGFVPVENIRGEAMFVWWSTGAPDGIRVARIGKRL